MQMDVEKRPACKVVMLGNSGVGKTSIVMRWSSGNYHSDIPSTIGANHQRKTLLLGDSEVDLYVWDTAGQEQFQALTPLYARSASAAIIVVAADDLNSFNAIANWIDLVQTSCERFPPLILAVNKIDLPKPVLTDEEVHSKFAQKFQSTFYVSAKTGESIDTLFLSVGEAAYRFSVSGGTQSGHVPEARDDADKGCC
jgi:small GTP-binding protein